LGFGVVARFELGGGLDWSLWLALVESLFAGFFRSLVSSSGGGCVFTTTGIGILSWFTTGLP
jgi:hypothetical protein